MITLPSSRSPAVQLIGIILFIATSIGFYGCNDVSNAPPPPEGPGALTVSSNALPTGFIGVAYPNLQLAGAGGTPPYTWSEGASSPGLPPGLALNSSGVISGTPTQTGAFSPTFRLVDSAKPPAAVEKVLTVTVSQVPQPSINNPSLPNGVQNRNYSATLTASGGTQPYTNWSVTPALPPGLTFTSAGATATITGTPAGITNTTHTFRVTDSFSPTPQTGSTQLTLTVTAAPLPLSISTGSPLQDGTVNQSYGPITLSAAGGTPTLVWDLASGSLPPGLQLSQGGILSGTPTAPSSVTPVFRVRDGGSPQQTATKPLAISISLPAPLTITTATLPDGQLGQSYNQTVQASGGSGARNWSFQGGNIPNLSINPSTGVISGSPTPTGTFTFTVQVTDAVFTTPATQTFTIKINPPAPPNITTSSLPTGTVNFPYTPTTLTATGGAAPLSFQPVGLPFGLSFNASTGTISGTPTSNGTQNVTFTVQDSTVPTNQTGSKALTLTVNAALTIDTASLPGGTVSQSYGPVTLSASGGAGPSTYTWSATGLPPGISVSQSGIIGGTPSAVGQYPVTFRVQDGNNIAVTKALTITVSAVVITPTSLPPGKELLPYAFNMSASGGTPPYTWSATGLPSGLSISPSGPTAGLITGIPGVGTSTASPYSVTITATDSANVSSPSQPPFSLTIAP
ncbi:putative Ig domain-containing protein [Nitrospira sp. KM1]|uniref:putative Ig domain-containing protein n=1 Tax=Nitrospira sp. KM1 TaxID=1936990 RepID=UPI00156346AF|nr:putative Ig domain-containing protein [Nitrospira sp. KM1]